MFFKRLSHRALGCIGRGDWMLKRISRRLELDAVQQTRLSELRQRMQSGHDALRRARSDHYAACTDLLGPESFDQNRAAALIETALKTANERVYAVMSAFAEFYDDLNAEQKERVRHWWRGHRPR